MPKKSGLFEATIWYGIGNLVVRLVGFVLLPLYSNLIPVEQFGIFSLLMSTYAIAAVFYQFGMSAALTNFFLKESDEKKRRIIFSTVLNSIIIVGAILTFLALLLSTFLSNEILGNAEYFTLVILIFVILFLESISVFILQLFKTLEKSKRVVIYLFIGAILNLILNIWFVYWLKEGIKGIIFAHLISSSVVFMLLMPTIKNHYTLKINTKILKVILLFSLPLFLSGVFASGMDVADRFILDFFFGKKQVGEYSFAYRIAMITNIFVISFRTAWMPYALNRYQEGNYREHFGKTLLKLLTAGIFILLTVSFFAEDLFKIYYNGKFLFSPAYKNGLIILPYVVLGYIFSSLASFYSVYPFVSNKSYHFLFADGIGLVSNLILNFIFIPRIGLIGAGISTCLSFMIAAGYLYLISKGKIEILYQKSEIVVVSLAGLLFLILGTFYNNIIFQIILVIVFLLIVEFFIKIKLLKLFRLVQ